MSSREELKRFLSASRARIDPKSLGLNVNPRKRVQGLTREQVAELAGVSAHWYALFESGATKNISPGMIEAICRALTLNVAESVYLSRLAGQDRASGTYAKPSADISLIRRIVDNYAGPAWMFGPRFDIHAVNRICAALIPLQSILGGRFRGNLLWSLFMDRAWHKILDDWETIAEDRVAVFRASYGRHADEPAFQELVGALLSESIDFAHFWRKMKVQLHNRDPLKATIHHPKFGSLNFDSMMVPLEEGSEVMICFGVPLDADTRAVIRRLNPSSNFNFSSQATPRPQAS